VDSTATLISGDKVIKLSEFKKGANVNVTWEVIKGKKTATKIDEKSRRFGERKLLKKAAIFFSRYIWDSAFKLSLFLLVRIVFLQTRINR